MHSRACGNTRPTRILENSRTAIYGFLRCFIGTEDATYEVVISWGAEVKWMQANSQPRWWPILSSNHFATVDA
jgi:hypothetical protein